MKVKMALFVVCVSMAVSANFSVYGAEKDSPWITNNLSMIRAPLAKHYYFLQIRLTDESGKPATDRYFTGRPPKVGEAVEMVLEKIGNDGEMSFTLRVKDK